MTRHIVNQRRACGLRCCIYKRESGSDASCVCVRRARAHKHTYAHIHKECIACRPLYIKINITHRTRRAPYIEWRARTGLMVRAERQI